MEWSDPKLVNYLTISTDHTGNELSTLDSTSVDLKIKSKSSDGVKQMVKKGLNKINICVKFEYIFNT